MSELTVEFTVPFREPIVFEDEPPSREQPLVFTIPEPRIVARLFADPADDFRVTHIDGVPLTHPEWTRCRVLRLAMTLDAPDDVSHALLTSAPNATTEKWGATLLAATDRVLSAVIDYTRNIRKQFWLEWIESDRDLSIQESLDRWNAQLVLDTHTRELRVQPGITMTLAIPSRGNPLSAADLEAMTAFVERGKASPAWQEFDANALRERAWNNHRSAVVEAATAYESALKTMYPRVVLAHLGNAEVTRAEVDKLIEKAGVRATSAVLVKLTLHRLGWSEETIERLHKALHLRNTLIHNSKRRPDRLEAIAAVSIIHKALSDLAASERDYNPPPCPTSASTSARGASASRSATPASSPRRIRSSVTRAT